MNMDYGALAPEIIVLGGAILTLMLGSYLPRRRQYVTRYLAFASLAASAIAAVASISAPSSTIFDGSYALDSATSAGRLIIPLATILIIALGRDEFHGSPRESETYSLLLLATLGTMILAGTSDLLVLSTGYLLATIPLYALVGLDRSANAAEASLKTYLLGALLGVVMLSGVSVLFGVGGATAYAPLGRGLAAAPSAAVAAGIVAILAGLLFKAGGVPGHFWVPDASEASGRAVAAFITTVPKVGALLATARLLTVLPTTVDIPLLIGILAALTMTLGNFAAYWQTNVRRLLGWSTVSQVGYLLLPIAVIGLTHGALPALVLYLAGYAVTNITAFAVVAALPARVELRDWAGASRRHPILTAALIISLLGLVGTPPTIVFFAKLAVFTTAWDGGLVWLVVIAAINTVISLFYYLRWITAAFVPSSGPTGSSERAGWWPAFVAFGGAFLSIVVGILTVVFPLVGR